MSGVVAFLRAHRATASAFGLALALFVVGALHSSGFASGSNIREMLIFASFIGFVAVGQTLVVLAGGLDLSVPWLMAFGGIQLSRWATDGVPGAPAIVMVVVAGALIGAVSGIGVAWLRIPPIVMTLGVGGLVQAYLLSVGLLKAKGNGIPAAAADLATSRVGPVPIVLLVWAVVAIGIGVLLSRTAMGQRIYAVGSNDVVADLSGVDVRRVRFTTYVISGAAAAFAGIILSGYLGTTYLDIGGPFLFTSIAAVVVGGASILGGRGTYYGTVAGALTLTVLSAVLPLFHLTDAELKIVYGVVILVGVAASSSSGALFSGRRRSARPDAPPTTAGSTSHEH